MTQSFVPATDKAGDNGYNIVEKSQTFAYEIVYGGSDDKLSRHNAFNGAGQNH